MTHCQVSDGGDSARRSEGSGARAAWENCPAMGAVRGGMERSHEGRAGRPRAGSKALSQ